MKIKDENAPHLGLIIKEVYQKSPLTVGQFAKAVGCNRTNIYSIFERESLDTALLVRISRVLQHNFFQYIEI